MTRSMTITFTGATVFLADQCVETTVIFEDGQIVEIDGPV